MKNPRIVLLITVMLLMRGCLCATKKRYFENGTDVLCTGVVCPKDHIFVPCTAGDGITDSCEPCPSDRPVTNGESPNSAVFSEPLISFQCRDPEEDCSCSEESRLMNRDECNNTLEPICQCDITKGYFGKDPKICNTSYSDKCKRPGYQLLVENGECLLCGRNTYKDTYGFGECISQPNCKSPEVVNFQGNASARRTCKSIDLRVTTKKPMPSDTISMSTSTQPSPSTVQKDLSTSKPKTGSNENEESKVWEPFVIFIGILVAVGLIIAIVHGIRTCHKKCSERPEERDYENLPTRENSSSYIQDKSLNMNFCNGATDSKSDLFAVENELKAGTQNSADKLENCLEINQQVISEHKNIGFVSSSSNASGHHSNEIWHAEPSKALQNTIQRDSKNDSIPEEDIGACGTALGQRDEPDGAENVDGATSLKEVKGSQSSDALESRVDHETFAKSHFSSKTEENTGSHGVNVESLLKSEPISNGSVPSVGLRRVPPIDHPLVLQNSAPVARTDSGIGSNLASTGGAALDCQPVLCLSSFEH